MSYCIPLHFLLKIRIKQSRSIRQNLRLAKNNFLNSNQPCLNLRRRLLDPGQQSGTYVPKLEKEKRPHSPTFQGGKAGRWRPCLTLSVGLADKPGGRLAAGRAPRSKLSARELPAGLRRPAESERSSSSAPLASAFGRPSTGAGALRPRPWSLAPANTAVGARREAGGRRTRSESARSRTAGGEPAEDGARRRTSGGSYSGARPEQH